MSDFKHLSQGRGVRADYLVEPNAVELRAQPSAATCRLVNGLVRGSWAAVGRTTGRASVDASSRMRQV